MTTFVAVAPHTRSLGFDGTRRSVPEAYEVLALEDALGRTYPTDAHLVTYVVEGARWQPRINKVGLAHYPGQVSVGVFFCDVDNPGHATWTDELLAEAAAEYAELDVLQTAGVYHTAKGRRFVQPISEPIPAAKVEPYVWRWFQSLADAGIAVDWTCRDWTRHFRLPHVLRDGWPYRSPLVDLQRMKPIRLPPLDPVSDSEALRNPPRRLRPLGPPLMLDWTADLPAEWADRIPPLAAAVRDVVTPWHELFLALAGALVTRGTPPGSVPAVCRAISLATGADDRTDSRLLGARSTIRRFLAGDPVTGYASLSRRWPDVAAAIDEILPGPSPTSLVPLFAPPPAPELVSPNRTLAEIAAALEQAIRDAPDGVTLIKAACGLGKSRAALRVATERAKKDYLTPDAEGLRVPLGSKTSISVDKNGLARQFAEDLRKMGTKALRIFGPLSVIDVDGAPVCRMHEIAQPLVAGGQSMQWELCQGRGVAPCEYAKTCSAKDGLDGPDGARVMLGPHQLVASLGAAAGTTGLLVIDEPPPLLETTLIPLDDLVETIALLDAFDARYAAALTPALTCLRDWVRDGEPDQQTTLREVVKARSANVPAELLALARDASQTMGDALDCADGAPFPEKRPENVPPIAPGPMVRARRSVHYARRVGRASGVLRRIQRALLSETRFTATLVDVGPTRQLALTGLDDRLVDAVTREGAVVVTDANAELHVPVLTKALGYEPRLVTFDAPDGAPIQRTLILTRGATRRGWFSGKRLQVTASLVTAVRQALEWAAEDLGTRRLGIITMQAVELALRAGLHQDAQEIHGAWSELDQDPDVLAEAKARLGPLMRSWSGSVLVAHYGAIRGLNDMAEVDALITLGDPWTNLGDVERYVAYLSDPRPGEQAGWTALDQARDRRAEALCRAELEQAHGRLRVIHRARPGRALHVGRVMPGGSGWAEGKVDVRQSAASSARGESGMTKDELEWLIGKLGGARAAAEKMGCSVDHLKNIRAGRLALSTGLLHSLRGFDKA